MSWRDALPPEGRPHPKPIQKVHKGESVDTSDAQACDALSKGRTMPVWSRVLGEWIYWVRDEQSKELLAKRFPEAVAYSLAELRTLVQSHPSHDQLRAIHELKKAFGGTLTPKADSDRMPPENC